MQENDYDDHVPFAYSGKLMRQIVRIHLIGKAVGMSDKGTGIQQKFVELKENEQIERLIDKYGHWTLAKSTFILPHLMFFHCCLHVSLVISGLHISFSSIAFTDLQ